MNTSRCTSAIWYFEPYGILTPGPNFIHGKLNPHGILNSLISNQDIGKGFDLPWVGGSKYHAYGIRYTMGRRSKVHKHGVRYIMGRRFALSCIGGLIYHGYGIQNIMGGVFEIPWDISFKILPSQIYSFGRNLAARVTNVWEKLVLVSYHRSYISLEGIWQFWYNWTRYCCSIKLEFWSLKKNGEAYLKI